MATTILVMIDGLSADDLRDHPHDLPTLHAVAADGLRVDRLASQVPATSLPGRTGIVTGVPPAVHGVYGNVVHDGERFRYANPDDVRVPTLARRARDAGLDVAVAGYGMVRPEDATTFAGPWWAKEMLQRARDAEPVPADAGWLRTMEAADDPRLARLAADGVHVETPDAYDGDRMHYLMHGLEGDRRLLRLSAALATDPTPPDLILTEILIPDSVQHVAGPRTPASVWSLAFADALVATLLQDLDRAGRRDAVNLMLLSDHGHGGVERALHPERLLPDHPAAPEGGALFVAVPEGPERADVDARLAGYGIAPLEPSPIPVEDRARLAAYVAPAGAVFERAPEGAPADATSGPPGYRSAHGLRPGTPSDDRFLVAAGPHVPTGRLAAADAEDVEATLAAWLGLAPAGIGRPLGDA
ncbi:MAG: alkaline phosphatase family protein [Trueperaceae bacterium]|nr:alkaline phosphatase family protein [Trueperaceae bacterium]